MLLGALLLLSVSTIVFSDYQPTWDSLDSRPLPQWYDQAKIGVFLHWGVFSVPSFGSVWFWADWKLSKTPSFVKFMEENYKPNFSYQDFASQFTAELFDPDQWADIFKASGAKYIVLTSKHHEGYTLWPSNVSWNWNAKDVGPGRDLLGDLANAVRNKSGIHFGIYHSLFEWFNPLYLIDKQKGYKTNFFVDGKTMPELIELVTTYKPEVIWSDGDWEAPDNYWKSKEFLAWLYNKSPVKDTVVVNDRWGSNNISCHHGDFYTCADKFNPKTLQKHKWENAMTLDKSSWGYRRNAKLEDFLTIEELITTLAETISCNGNLLINVGPTHDGRIAPIFEERLRQLGSWLSVNGEAIYESKPWTYQNDTLTPGVWFTSKQNYVYAIVLKWPQNNILTLGALEKGLPQHSDIYMLGVQQSLSWKKDSQGQTVVTFPALTPATNVSQWAWVLKISKTQYMDNKIFG